MEFATGTIVVVDVIVHRGDGYAVRVPTWRLNASVAWPPRPARLLIQDQGGQFVSRHVFVCTQTIGVEASNDQVVDVVVVQSNVLPPYLAERPLRAHVLTLRYSWSTRSPLLCTSTVLRQRFDDLKQAE